MRVHSLQAGLQGVICLHLGFSIYLMRFTLELLLSPANSFLLQ